MVIVIILNFEAGTQYIDLELKPALCFSHLALTNNYWKARFNFPSLAFPPQEPFI